MGGFTQGFQGETEGELICVEWSDFSDRYHRIFAGLNLKFKIWSLVRGLMQMQGPPRRVRLYRTL